MASKKKDGKKPVRDIKRYQIGGRFDALNAHFKAAHAPVAAEPTKCDQIHEIVDKILKRDCARKEFVIQSRAPCAKGGGATAPVDLVIVIDTSGSMSDEATDLSNAADAAIQAAAKSCPSDLRVEWFGIEGTWPGTKFNQSYRDYLNGIGVPDADIVGTPGDLEDGAAAIMDLSDHFDWRVGAARAIFFLGDEPLEAGLPQDAADVTAADAAIATAQARGVTVFTYAGTGIDATALSEYARVATQTGGQAFVNPIAGLGGFQAVLEEIICASQGGGCGPVEAPTLTPCIELRWGDGPKDHIETDDFEVVCLTVCNPYSNVTFKDFTAHVIPTTATGTPIPNLPDGTPSVLVKPSYEICFGDIGPCDPKKPDEFSCVARELVIKTCGALEGPYRLNVVYCFDAEFENLGIDVIDIELVKS